MYLVNCIAKYRSAMLLGFAFAQAATVNADALQPDWEFAGYGTLGAVYHDEPGVEYRRDISQGRGAKPGEIDLGVDSRLGLQLNAPLSSRWEVVVQTEAGLRTDRSWKPTFNWALLKYTPNDSLTLRAGRLSIDPYLSSDSRGVGYSSVMVRPAIEVFGVLNAQRYDGADAVIGHPLGSGQLEVKLYGGWTQGSITYGTLGGFNLDGSLTYGGHLQWTDQQWDLRLSALTITFERNLADPSLRNALRSIGTAASLEAAEAFTYRDRRISILSFGALFTREELQAQFMVSHASTRQPGPELPDVGLVSVARRMGRFMPYLGLSAARSKRHLFLGTGIPDAAGPEIARLNAGLDFAQRVNWDNQQSLTAGVRYDFIADFSLKAQVDRVHFQDSSVLIDRSGGLLTDRTFAVFSLALDFVF
ncbi:MAG: hypothetical protein ABW106_12020 [Steroidobacteraceae bacterium]